MSGTDGMYTPSKRCAPIRILLPLCDDAPQYSIQFVLEIIFDLPIGFPINNILSLFVGFMWDWQLNWYIQHIYHHWIPCIYVLHSRLPRLDAVPWNVSSPATMLHSSPDVSARAIFTLFTLCVHHSSVSYWHVLPHPSKNPFWCQLWLYPMNTRIVDGDARGLSIHTLVQRETHKVTGACLVCTSFSLCIPLFIY